MCEKVISIIIGYFFGSFLTAEVIARKYAGKPAAEIGDTGNPGMANIMASLGFVPGILTLVGDLLKVILAASLCKALFFRTVGKIVVFYAGVGCTLGHDFPFWQKFRGGKGVATTSISIALYHFPFGLLANIAGMLVVLSTKYLCIGGPAIPVVFAVALLAQGDLEAAALAAILCLLSFVSHGRSITGIRKGITKQTDVVSLIGQKLKTVKK